MEQWKRFEEDGAEWEARLVASEEGTRSGEERPDEILEFRCLDGTRPPRRVAVDRGALEAMDEAALRSAYRQARPIGGDFYGRPGKRMTDTVEEGS